MTASELSSSRRSDGAPGEAAEVSPCGDVAELDLESLYRSHALELSRFIARLCGRDDDPADVLHEVFIVAQRRLGSVRPDASARTWLYAIAARVVAGRRQKRRLRRLLWLESGADNPERSEPIDPRTPEHELEWHEASRRVQAVLERLAERDRALLVLFELEGFSARDIAKVVGASENSVWVGLSRARARFRKIFCELFGSEGAAHG
jgi:RNA polymerase sigma-70 factor, ECF subfamily